MGRRQETGLIVPDSVPNLWPRGELGVIQDLLQPGEMAKVGSKGIWPKILTSSFNILFLIEQLPAPTKSQFIACHNTVRASVTVIQEVVHLALVHLAQVHQM